MLAPDIDLDAVKHLYAIDPTVTALAHCKSSGGTARPELDQLDPDMATGVSATTITYDRLKVWLASQVRTPAKKAKIVKAWRTSAAGLKSDLPSCAACGRRGIGQVVQSVQLGLLDCYRSTAVQIATIESVSVRYRPAFSVYTRDQDGAVVYYNLHPELACRDQKIPAHEFDPIINVTFPICEASCLPGVPHDPNGPVPKPPKLSLQAGIDFGWADRIGLPALTPVERALISPARIYGTIIKLTDSGQHQRRLRGHMITFRHSGAGSQRATTLAIVV